MEKNHHNDAPSGTHVVGTILDGGKGNPGCESATHARVGDQEQGPTANAVDHEGEEDGFDPICDTNDAVELVLEFWVCDTNIGQDFAQVVAGETSASKLREETTTNADEKTPSVAA